MLSRRKFSACAICAIAGFAATAVEAQAQSAGGINRTILQKTEFPEKYMVITAIVDIPAGATAARHTHPGVESAYVLEGQSVLSVQGQPVRTVKAGDSFQIAAGTPHGARNGDKPQKLIVTYVVEKDKPLAAIVPTK